MEEVGADKWDHTEARLACVAVAAALWSPELGKIEFRGGRRRGRARSPSEKTPVATLAKIAARFSTAEAETDRLRSHTVLSQQSIGYISPLPSSPTLLGRHSASSIGWLARSRLTDLYDVDAQCRTPHRGQFVALPRISQPSTGLTPGPASDARLALLTKGDSPF